MPKVVAVRILGVCHHPSCVVLCLWFALLASFVFFSLFSFPLPVSLQVRLSPNLPFELPLAVLGGIIWGMVQKLGQTSQFNLINIIIPKSAMHCQQVIHPQLVPNTQRILQPATDLLHHCLLFFLFNNQQFKQSMPTRSFPLLINSIFQRLVPSSNCKC